MPFVQRVVSPTYLSRSRPRSCQAGQGHRGGAPLGRRQPQAKAIAGPSVTGGGRNPGESVTFDVTDSYASAHNHLHCDPQTSSSIIAHEIIANGTLNGNGVVSGSGSHLIAPTAALGGDSRSNSPATSRSGPSARPTAPVPLSLLRSTSPAPVVTGHEFESVTNITLSNALRQLASLVLIANDIFTELNDELQAIGDRSRGIKQRIVVIEEKVQQYDPKLVPVPESDLETFVHIKNHFKSIRPVDKELFTPATRSSNLRQLYEAAAKTPISNTRESGETNDEQDTELICTPVLGQKFRKMRSRIDVEIETRLPAAVEELRKWTSTEALGDITVTPDCISRVGHSTSIMNSTTTTSTFNSSTITRHGNVSSVSPSRIVQQQMQQQQQQQFLQSSATTDIHSIDVTDDNSTVIGAAQLSSSSTTSNNNNRTANEDDDLPLDHRLPSPEEQCQIIAMKFPAEVVTVDVTGRRFQRMCNARKSMTNYMAIGDHNNLDDDVQTVRRRSRSRKPRGKRRNTIAGTDQREIEEAANGNLQSSPSQQPTDTLTPSKFGRSKSSDLLKKDSPPTLSPLQNAASGNVDTGKTTLTRFNSLKQWGRNRLRWIQRNDDKESDKDKDKERDKDKVLDIDAESNVCETIVNGKAKKKLMEKERKLSHERKPSYSSSEKSLSLMAHPIKATATNAASINPVKMRETSSLRRQRRNSGLDLKDEPHSSSGNWSASSESGRTSIGSEITVQPKSSASSTSLNHSNLHSGSGPPSSIISRRRFLNTSASSSVTSEGTATPDLQMHDLFYDDETSSAYSCDTEGYYTSFHVDSGLKTLKEEEPMTPLHSTSALSSTTSFSSTMNQTVLTAESEYELFGRGSTSTTTSSAGTVCTTLMATDTDRSSMHGPAVPERKSSLTKLNRSNSNASGGTLERSYSSSTVGSTLERTGTIKRNGVLIQKEVAVVIHQQKTDAQQKSNRIDSPDSGNNTSSSPIETNSNESPTQGLRSNSEFEYSECSDLEGVDRIERIRVKTAINSSRIPSMCIITPTTSDDEAVKEVTVKSREKIEPLHNERPVLSFPSPPPPQETDLDTLDFVPRVRTQNNNLPTVRIKEDEAGYVTVSGPTIDVLKTTEVRKDANFNNFRKTTLQPLNTMLGKLKGVLPNLKKSSPNKEANPALDLSDESLYNNAGEYVTIADVRNNNNNNGTHKRGTSNGIYYSNDIVKRNLATVLSGNLNQETEYVSLNELPCTIRCESSPSIAGNILIPHEADSTEQPTRDYAPKSESTSESSPSEPGTRLTAGSKAIGKDKDGERQQDEHKQPIHNHQHPPIRGARVTFDAQGKVVYNSDSLKRRKGAHTTFVPGPCVKDPTTSALSSAEVAASSPSASSSPTPSGSSELKAASAATESKPTAKATSLVSSLVRKPNIVVRPVVSQKTNLIAATALENVDMATDVLSGRYIREKSQPHADNRDISLALPQPTSTIPANTYHCAPYDVEDYQHLSPKEKYQQYEKRIHQQQVAEQPQRHIMPNTPSLNYNSDGRFYSVAGQSPFQRNNHIYWTLQHKRQPASVQPDLPRDDTSVATKAMVDINDLYATPNKIRNREVLKTTPLGFSTFFSPIKTTEEGPTMSPIDPRNIGGFKTSTPSKSESPSKGLLADELRHRLHIQDGTRSYNASPSSSGRSTPLRGLIEQQQPRLRHSWAPETPELPKTCSDRFGTQKTSLMDFKKLLLAKSTKITSTKISAVEQLKLNKKEQAAQAANQQTQQVLNTSMNILELSGSPKTFANRRMIRQGNFGSPSKTFGSKQRTGWRMNANRTDIMSTAIPEANSEEDASSSNSSAGSIGRRSPNININSNNTNNNMGPAVKTSISPSPLNSTPEKTVIDDKINLKTNIFLQAEENNFMKGEMKNSCGITKSQMALARAQFLMGSEKTQKYEYKDRKNELPKKDNFYTANSNMMQTPMKNSENPTTDMHTSDESAAITAPSLETAL